MCKNKIVFICFCIDVATVVGFMSVAVSFLGNNERHKTMKNFEIMEVKLFYI